MAYKFLESKISVSTDNAIHVAKNIKLQDLDNPELRLESCGNLASKLAESDRIREELIFFQRDFPKKKVGAVLDGRDIGSVIFPNAKIKFFVTADLEVRAQRRKEEYKKIGKGITDQKGSYRLEFLKVMLKKKITIVATT